MVNMTKRPPFNREINDYTPLKGVPNAFYETRKGLVPSTTDVHPHLAYLLLELVKYRPTWTFVTTSHSAYVNSVFKVNVFERDYVLGYIEWNMHSERYEADGPRMRVKRTRGCFTFTKDVRKMLKHIYADFHAPSTEEEFKTAEAALTSKVRSLHMEASHEVSRAYSNEAKVLLPLVLKHWDEVSAKVAEKHDLPVLYDHLRDMGNAANTLKDSRFSIMLPMGNDYYLVWHKATNLKVQYHITELPPHLKLAMIELKLGEAEQYVAGKGIKSEEGAFYIEEPTICET